LVTEAAPAGGLAARLAHRRAAAEEAAQT
jgi:hypothetical protein